MSGIYIPGMEMPKNCCECPVNLELCKRGYKYLAKHIELYDQRADDCPLIPVPPHGDLIDRDAILRAYELSTSKVDCFGCKYKNEVLCPKYELCEALNDAPTIIPAECVLEHRGEKR